MKEVMWQFFEIVVNFYQGIVMIYFPFKYLGGKYSDKFVKNYGLRFSCLLALIMSVFNHIMLFESFYTSTYFVVIFTYSYFCLGGNIPHKIFASVYSLLIIALSSGTIVGLSPVIFNKLYSEILTNTVWQRIVILLSVQLLALYIMFISLTLLGGRYSKSPRLSNAELFSITVILFVSIINEALFHFVSFGKVSEDTSSKLVAMGFLCVIIINIVTLYMITDLKNKNKSVMENDKLKLQLEYNRQYIKNADTEYELIRKLRHDTKNVYVMIDRLLAEGNVDSVRTYIKKITDIADDRIIFVKTENDVLNSVINTKFAIAKSFGINATCLSVDSFEGIDDIDLCRLLSNMIENAITATSYSKAKEKELVLRISKESERFLFLVKNSIDESVLSANPDLQTTKKSKNSHGYGTKIIRDIAESYNGHCDFYEEDDMFCCLAVLNPTINNRKRP